jgi:hypothetical protein
MTSLPRFTRNRNRADGPSAPESAVSMAPAPRNLLRSHAPPPRIEQVNGPPAPERLRGAGPCATDRGHHRPPPPHPFPSARRTASRQLFPAWLDTCAVHIETQAPVLTDGHRRALTALWEIARQREGPIPEFIELYLKRERKAEFLRLWGPDVMPGLLKTYEYAHAMYKKVSLDDDEATEKATANVERRWHAEGLTRPSARPRHG